MASTFVVPELEIEPDEAKMLAESLADVSSFYNQAIDPKIVAWIGLAGVCGKLYGPRIGAYRVRKMVEGKQEGEKKSGPVGVVPKTNAKADAAPANFDMSTLVSIPLPGA